MERGRGFSYAELAGVPPALDRRDGVRGLRGRAVAAGPGRGPAPAAMARRGGVGRAGRAAGAEHRHPGGLWQCLAARRNPPPHHARRARGPHRARSLCRAGAAGQHAAPAVGVGCDQWCAGGGAGRGLCGLVGGAGRAGGGRGVDQHAAAGASACAAGGNGGGARRCAHAGLGTGSRVPARARDQTGSGACGSARSRGRTGEVRSR